MSKARELAELSRTVSDSADATAITINSSEEVTFADDIFLADGKKVVLGAGSDLQLYHDGSNSWVSDQGTGQLILESGGAGVYIQKGATESMANFIADGAVSLYHDNSKKFETTSSGIAVSGSVTASTSGNSFTHGTSWGTNLTLTNTNDDISPPIITFQKSPASGHSAMADNDYIGFINFRADNSANQAHSWVEISAFANDVTDGSEDSSLRIGTWGGGTEYANTLMLKSGSVGIGIAPSNTFSVGASGTVTTRYTSTDTSAFSLLQFENTGSIVFSADHGNSAASSDIVFKSDGAQERMRIGSTGNVGIGTSSPGGLPLHLKVASGDNKLRMQTANKDAFVMELENSTGNLKLGTNTTAGALVIADGGNVGIGAAPNTTNYGGTFKYLGVNAGAGYGVIEGQTSSVTAGDGAASFFASTTGSSGLKLLGGMQVYNHASSSSNAEGGLKFFTSTGGNIPVRLTITNDGVAHFGGDVKVLSGDIQMGSGRGINFTASSNFSGMSSETLDDYEEGTWTPVFESSTTTVHNATYTKVGRVVHIQLYIGFTAAASSSQAQINGLPFPSATDTGQNNYSVCSIGFVGGANMSLLANALFANNGASFIYFHRIDGNGSTVTKSTFNSNGCNTLIMSGFYMTNS